MSNRSLFEINHDYWHEIEARPEEFVKVLLYYLGNGDRKILERIPGRLRCFGMRHHSEGFKIRWGAHCAEELPERSSASFDAALEFVKNATQALGQQLDDEQLHTVARKVVRAMPKRLKSA